MALEKGEIRMARPVKDAGALARGLVDVQFDNERGGGRMGSGRVVCLGFRQEGRKSMRLAGYLARSSRGDAACLPLMGWVDLKCCRVFRTDDGPVLGGEKSPEEQRALDAPDAEIGAASAITARSGTMRCCGATAGFWVAVFVRAF